MSARFGLPLSDFLCLTGSLSLSSLEPCAADPERLRFLPSPSLLLPLALRDVGTCWLSFALRPSRPGASDSMAGGVLLMAATREFELGGENNATSTASFVPFFAISLRAAISVPSDRIARFSCLHGDM